jgi:hypothetical protein
VERYDVTNQYVPVDNGNVWTHNTTWAELTLSEGRYRAKVQTMSCGKNMGPWSDMLQFSVEGIDPPPNNQPAISQESAEGTSVFPESGQSLIDSSGAVWTFGDQISGAFYRVLRNGALTCGLGCAIGSQLKYHDHAVYHHGNDDDWYVWDGSVWVNVGPTEP